VPPPPPPRRRRHPRRRPHRHLFGRCALPLQALAAADGAAYLAGNDYSAQTTFRRGESTDTPNLDAAFQSVSEAQQALARILEIVQAGG